MNRRRYLAAVAISFGFPGCAALAETDSQPSTSDSPIAVTAPPVVQGETATITVNAQSVARLRFSDTPDIEIIEYGDAEFSPSPSGIYDMLPPTWVWSPPENATCEIPIAASDDTPPGTYQYTMAMKQGDAEEEVVRTFTVTVRE